MLAQLRKNSISVLTWMCIILFVYLFFYVAHPLYIFDTDDWTYIATSRHAIPWPRYWNPGKVLPETLMPLVAQFGVSVLYPICGDYIQSLAMAFAMCLTVIIALYLYFFSKVLKNRFQLSVEFATAVVIVFLLYHWLIFHHRDEKENIYYFWSSNVNCLFNYVIPLLINSIMVLLIMGKESIWDDIRENVLRTGIFVMGIYFALFSNLFHSIVLASFSAANLIENLWKARGKNKKAENIVFISIILTWLLANCVEALGGRASAQNSISGFQLGKTACQFVSSVVILNKGFVISIVCIILMGILILIRNSRSSVNSTIDEFYRKQMIIVGISAMLTICYLLLLCTAVNPRYILGTDVMISWLFWLMLAGFFSFSYLIKSNRIIMFVIPLFIWILIFETVVDNGMYKNMNVLNENSGYIKQFDDSLVSKIVDAEKQDLEEVVIKVPRFGDETWPLAIDYGGNRISSSLYRHGIIKKEIKIVLSLE